MTALQHEIMRSRTRIQIIGREARDVMWDARGAKLFEQLTDELANLAWVLAQDADNRPFEPRAEGE